MSLMLNTVEYDPDSIICGSLFQHFITILCLFLWDVLQGSIMLKHKNCTAGDR